MFDEAEKEFEITVKIAEAGIEVAAHKRKPKRTHEEMLKELPIEEVVHEAEEKCCPDCGIEMEIVGKEYVRDELVYVPANLFVRKHYAEVLKCTVCGNDESRDAELSDIEKAVFGKATVPSPLIPHSFCSPELLAHILFEKYCQAGTALPSGEGIQSSRSRYIKNNNGKLDHICGEGVRQTGM